MTYLMAAICTYLLNNYTDMTYKAVEKLLLYSLCVYVFHFGNTVNKRRWINANMNLKFRVTNSERRKHLFRCIDINTRIQEL